MRVLHFYPGKDNMVTEYVDMLQNVMAEHVETKKSCELSQFKIFLKQWHPDIVHLHGCWDFSIFIAMTIAHSNSIRYVFTPHGQLEPWIMRQNYWCEKLPKLILFQRRLFKKAYTIVALGDMEANYIKNYRWNDRIEIVRNPLITETITRMETGRRLFSIYRKVLNSDTIKLLNKNAICALATLIKAGQTLNEKWIVDKEYNRLKGIEHECLFRLFLYSYQEEILDTVTKGANVLQFSIPDIDFSTIPFYIPARFNHPKPLLVRKSSNANIDYITMIKAANERISQKKITLKNILEISSFLRTTRIEDDKVERYLIEEELYDMAGRLMQVAADYTGLDIGFMPVRNINDRKTKRIKRIINKHLEI